ncbi:MAG: hypothetical protein AMS24_03565 [Chlamydiae bacterium SM23_39]|nr:MAG: hypothetical protein AMS24_03565 [Chlamydiae bacterium SM23_39]
MKNKKIIAVIPARYGSKRLSIKPLIKILKKTLLQRTFERVKLCSFLDDIYIATDHIKIYSHAKKFTNKIIMTSSKCKNGTERIIEALNKNKNLKKADIIINIQGDLPCISPTIIKKAVDILDEKTKISTCAAIIKNKKEINSKNIVKVVFDNFYNALYFSRSPIPFLKNFKNKTYFHHIGIYAYKKNFLLKILPFLKETPLQKLEDLEQLKILEHGYKIKVSIVEENPLSIDTKEDIKKVEKFLCQQNIYL